MSVKLPAIGRDTIKLLKDIFHIDVAGIRKLTLVATPNDLTTISLDIYPRLNEVDITSTEINKGDVIDTHTYEVSVKRFIKESK